MKSRSARLGSAQSLVALSVSVAVVLSTHTFAFASLANSGTKSLPTKSAASQKETASPQNGLRLTSVSATATAEGVLLQWRTNSTSDNLGFNVYRLKDGQRTRVNREIIPGAVFGPSAAALLRGGYSYAWFDRGGTADSVYYIESVGLEGTARIHEAVTPVANQAVPGSAQTADAPAGENASATESTDMFEKYYPAAESQQLNSPNGSLEDQWAIAAQSGLKIAIKKDGWYRVTQPQMAAAGFSPTVDIRNLRLFVDGREVAISTSQRSGQFGSGDYIEFYGRGLDTPTTDVRTYYLIAGTIPGKRVIGEIQADSDPDSPPAPKSTPTPPAPSPPPVAPSTSAGPVLRDPIFFSWAGRDLSAWIESLRSSNAPTAREPNAKVESSRLADLTEDSSQPGSTPPVITNQPVADASGSDKGGRSLTLPVPTNQPVADASGSDKGGRSLTLPVLTKQPIANAPRPVMTRASGKFRKRPVSKKRKKSKLRREFRTERNHAEVSAGFAPSNFDYTAERKDRLVYLSNLLNGDAENFFGQVIAGSPVTQTLTVSNPDLSAAGPASLEFALQGVMSQFGNPHDVNLTFNGVAVASLNFGPLEHPVQTVPIPVSLLQSGANALTFTKTSTGEVCIVDYVRLTYPHSFRADAGSLRFSLRGTQSRKVDGFATPLVRLIDYTDPFNVIVAKPDSEPSAPGYAITVPNSQPLSKAPRLLYAIPQGQFDQPAALSLNQPSTLNLNSNTADFLIVSHKTFIPSFTANVSPINTSLVAQRQNQGLTVSIVDVEDVYDEFSYGAHGPQAIKDFLQYAATHWNNGTAPPRYVVFAGDASFDPRNYMNVGNFDLVPTKLVDATYNETASDDWLTDFDDYGIADIPVGRLPVRTVAEANLVISKIVNFAPVNVPQTALLVADDPTGYYFNFETANDQVQSLVTSSLTVQKAYRRLEVKILTGTISTNSTSTIVTGAGTLFTTELSVGVAIAKNTGEPLGTVASISNNTSLTLTANATESYSGAYGKQDDAIARADIIAKLNSGKALVNYSGHGNVDVWTGASIFTSSDATALTNGNQLSFVVVMDCLNGYYQDPTLLSLSEALVKAPGGGAVAAFASSGLTLPDGQHEMSAQLYTLIYGAQPIALGDAIKIAKGATTDIDVRRTWIFFGDPSLKIR